MRLADAKGKVDFGIITVREDEFEAVLLRLPPLARVSGKREYNLARHATSTGGEYLVAVVRCLEPGTGEAQAVARDLLDDLEPQWLLLVGIAGGTPNDEVALGDVVVSSRVIDFTVEAVLEAAGSEYAVTGGSIAPSAAAVVANLPALPLGSWNEPETIVAPRPATVADRHNMYGTDEWQARITRALADMDRKPRVVAGAVASSDRLMKDTELLAVWLKLARQVRCVEMELGGAYRAARSRNPEVPLIAIRGISDIVGLKRDRHWTAYACHSAASFMLTFLHTCPIEPIDNRSMKPGSAASLSVETGSLIAVGPGVIGKGELIGADGPNWQLKLLLPFLLGHELSLAKLEHGEPADRYVVLERHGEGRRLLAAPRWRRDGEHVLVEVQVEPAAAKTRPEDLGEDLLVLHDQVPMDIDFGRSVRGLERIPQLLSMSLSTCKGGWGVLQEFGSRVPELYALLGRATAAQIIKLELARLANVSVYDELLKRDVIVCDFIERVLEVELLPDRAVGWLRARVSLALHGHRETWKGEITICLSTRELGAPPPLTIDTDP